MQFSVKTIKRLIGTVCWFSVAGQALAEPVVNFGPGATIDRFALTGGVVNLHAPGSYWDNYSGCALSPDGSQVLSVLYPHFGGWSNSAIEIHQIDSTHVQHIPLSGFSDLEGICLFNATSNLYAILEEGLNDITIAAVTDATTQIVKSANWTLTMGLGDLGNRGTEGVTYNASNPCFYVVKEKSPMAIYQAAFSETSLVVTTLFDAPTALTNICTDLSDIAYHPTSGHLFLLSQESRKVIECDLQGKIFAILPLDIHQPEGLSLSQSGQELAVVGEPNEFQLLHLGHRSVRMDEGTTLHIDLYLDSPAVTGAVDVLITSPTATPGQDFSPAAGTLFFTNGATSASFDITLIADSVLEGDETVSISLTNTVGLVLGDNVSFECTIVDPGFLTLSAMATQQSVRVPFPVTVTAVDSNGSTLTGYSGPATLQIEANALGSNVIEIGSGDLNWMNPINTYEDVVRTQVIYLTNELRGSCVITGIAVHVASVGGSNASNWKVHLKHTALSSYPTSGAGWENSGWTMAVSTQCPIGSTGWRYFGFSSPFTYNGSSNLLIDFSFMNQAASYTYAAKCSASRTTQLRSLCQFEDLVMDPTYWAGTYPLGAATNIIPDLRLHVRRAYGSAPSSEIPITLTNGAWTGSVTITQILTNAGLRVESAGHVARSGKTQARFTTNSPLYIQSSAAANGQIAPSGTVTLLYGQTTSFICQADSYYRIGTLKTNNVAVTLSSNTNVLVYAWTNVRTDGAIAITFTERITTNQTPEWWLAHYGWTNGFATAAGDDPDNDGFPTWKEYRAGTDPTNAASILGLESTDLVRGTAFVDFVGFVCTNGQHDHVNVPTYWSNQFCFGFSETNRVFLPIGWRFEWPSSSGRVYTLYGRTNTASPFSVIPSASNLPATPPLNVFTNSFPASRHAIKIGVSIAP